MSVARMREAIFGVGITFFPGYRFSHPGYDVLVIASWDRWIRHRPALDESLRLDVGSMTPFLSDFLPRSEATKQSKLSLRLDGLLRFARNDGTGRANARPMTGSAKPFFFFVAAMDCLVARAARNDGLPAT